MDQNPLIELSTAELAMSPMLAAMRNIANRSSGVVDARVGTKQSSLHIDQIGIMAEIAVGKYLNVYPDFSIAPRSGGADLVSREGRLIDVKAIDSPNSKYLLTRLSDQGKADVYFLALVLPPTVELLGWAWQDELINPSNVIDLGHGKTYGLNKDKLRRFKQADKRDVAFGRLA